MKTWITGLTISLLAVQAAYAQAKISDEYVARYVNQQVTVCGKIASTYYDSTSKRKPTFLNFRYPHPDETFTVVIWGDDRKNFPYKPETYLKNKQICVKGKITLFHDEPEMIITSPAQIELENEKP
ncbi:DNA-binding protein [Thermoflavifilum thermophilum]|uniref:Endonuclease G n=1 Tax=Thermoflavifilum thermophilum TaxID=1393122 RepID=A0A1I7N5Q6_9BACT|nr:DNA-binding protein [Thermoflavifilum thermophilum]SFV29913.1 endonuclease G [Thermoflavifilum thermophilum]